jgi:trans-aconitate 2-methyltransferase
MTSPWNPTQYERFANERTQPFLDLLEMVAPVPGGRAVDLGCGTGELTRLLHERTAAGETLGIDSSETMLARSVEFAGTGLRFAQGDIATFRPAAPFDVVFSNAALQWVPDHASLIPALTKLVAPAGQFAFQVPANDDHTSHVVAREVAGEEPFRSALRGYERSWPVMPPEWYAETLDALGFVDLDIRLQVYGHHLDSTAAVVEWVKGTYLTDYARRMPTDLYEAYLDRYRTLLLQRLGDRSPFFYTYKRILVHSRRG